MKIQNFFQMNDWDINRFLKVLISLQLSLIALIFVEEMGFDIPILRQLLAFIFLTFVPGFLILRILRLHLLGNIKTILYSVGISLSFLMIIGFFINLIYPIFGIKEPLSFLSLIITINIFVLILYILSYVLDKDFMNESYIRIERVPIPLFYVLTPFLAIFGTYLVNYHDNNIILMALLVIISIIIVLVSFGKIDRKYFPIIIFTIALSILYNVELITSYITGFDVNYEYYISNQVILNSSWLIQGSSFVNSVLSIAMIIPIYSKILNLNISQILKIIFPFFYALIPVSLYLVFKKQTNSKIAFLSCMVFITFFKYYDGYLGRQGIAEFFLALCIILLLENRNMKNSILLITFAISLAFSHYSLSYLFLFALLVLIIMQTIYNKVKHNEIRKDQFLTFITFFAVISFSWYMFTSKSAGFEAIVKIGNHISQAMFNELFNVETSQSLAIMTTSLNSPLHSISKYIHLLFQFFILTGFLVVFKLKFKFKKNYLFISTAFLLILIASFFIPFLASSLNTNRLYQIALMFLAPFSILGGIFLINLLNTYKLNLKKALSNFNIKKEASIDVPIKIISILIVFFFLFNVGFVYEVFNDQPTSRSLSQQNIENYGTNLDKASFFSTSFKDQDVNSIQWLSKNKNNYLPIFSDVMNTNLIFRSYGDMLWQYPLRNGTKLRNSYIYLRSINVLYGVMYSSTTEYYKIQDLEPQISESSLIYSNGDSKILFIENATTKVQYNNTKMSRG